MPIYISKDAGSGSGDDTIYTIRSFENLTFSQSNPTEVFTDIAARSEDALLIKALGPQMIVNFDWTITDESTSVVSGAGGSVTTAVGQQLYLYETLASSGSSQILDDYVLGVDYGGGVGFVKHGQITKLDCSINSERPLTFRGHIEFQLGTTF